MNDKKSFWGSLSAILVAVIGLLTVLYQKDIIPSPKPLPEPRPVPEPRPKPLPIQNISGTYLMDGQSNRLIVITNMNDNRYHIEEPTSPWPWEGIATLNDKNLNGEASFKKSSKKMRIEGTVHTDRSISVSYIFLGNATGRVDNHIWYLKR